MIKIFFPFGMYSWISNAPLTGDRSAGPIPSQLKIHPSVLIYLDLLSKDSIPANIQQHFPKANQTELLQSRLEVTFGLGVYSKSPNPDDPDVTPATPVPTIENVRKKLAHRNATFDLQSLVSPFTSHQDNADDLDSVLSDRNIWLKAHALLRYHESKTTHEAYSFGSNSREESKSICPDSVLTLESTPSSTLLINKIYQYMNSINTPSFRQACVLSLFSHLLTNYENIIDIRLKFPSYPLNLYNKGIVQNGTYSQYYPYHLKGLDGSGQIVGVGDTGIDELSCFFRNSDGSKVAQSSYTSPTFDLTKRKVIQYISYGDGRDLGSGHGTHVAGTIAGSSVTSNFAIHNGHAPGAKIAFFDMENSQSTQSGIIFPSPIGSNVFQVAYTAGARLHSNSWGALYNYYDSDVLSIDNFHSTRSDFLALFAAGNDGNDGYYHIGYPAVSKNAMAIGASMCDSSSTISRVAYFSGLGPTFDERIKPDVVGPGYYTTSARASSSTTTQTCAVLDMAGTSMATPLVRDILIHHEMM